MKKKIIVGSRDSKLAIDQSKIVIDAIKKANPHMELELVTMKTTGDIILDRTLDKVGGKGLFVKELDRALIEGKVDITIHSLKDMPMEVSDKLPLLAYFKRGNPFDVVVKRKNLKGGENIVVGTSSKRRSIQLDDIFKEYHSKSVRGNVLTRLQKLDKGEYTHLILAAAGLVRLGLEERIDRVLTHNDMIPAAGQGILVVQGRAGEDYSFLKEIDDMQSRMEAEIEREFVRTLDGGCSSPIGAFCQVDLDTATFKLHGLFATEDCKAFKKGSVEDRLDVGMQRARELAYELRKEVKYEG